MIFIQHTFENWYITLNTNIFNLTAREQYKKQLTNFIHTDRRDWKDLQTEVFNPKVHLDMSSLGQNPTDTTAVDICDMWAKGFEGIDAINHLAGNFVIEKTHNGKAEWFIIPQPLI